MNIQDIVLLGIIAAALFLAIRQLRRSKKCTGSCAHCPGRDGCDKK